MTRARESDRTGRHREVEDGRTVVGGRHGSPTVNVALPFSKLSIGGDDASREGLETLVGIVGELAAQVALLAERTDAQDVRVAVKAIAERVEAVLADLANR